jgi:hypothetical protein
MGNEKNIPSQILVSKNNDVVVRKSIPNYTRFVMGGLSG